MEKKCSPNNGNRAVVLSGAGADATETEAVQGSANGLNRAVSVESGESLSEILDESKTSEKSLRDRICNLWIVRKVIDFFKGLFYSKKVIDSVGERGGETVASVTVRQHEGCDALVVEANSLLDAVHDLGREITADATLVDNLRNVKVLIDKFASRLEQLKDDIEVANGSVDLKEKVTKIEKHIDWLIFYVDDIETNGHRTCHHRNDYDDVIERHYNVAKVMLESGNHELQLCGLSVIHERYKQSANGAPEDSQFAINMAHAVMTFKRALLKIIGNAGQLDQYQKKFFELANR